MKKAAVVGGAGFIGSNIANTLINRGVEVTVVDNLSTGLEENMSIDQAIKIIKEFLVN